MAVYYINVINENSTYYMFKKKQIRVDGPVKKIDIAIKLCNKYWEEILDEAAKRMYKHAEEIDFNRCPKNLTTKDDIRKRLKLESVLYDNEGNRHNPVCGTMNLSFDTSPSLDPLHMFTLYVDFNKDESIAFDSVYDG